MDCVKNNELIAPYYQFIVSECAKLFNAGNSMHLDLANEVYIDLVECEQTKLLSIIASDKMKAYIATKIHTQRRLKGSRFMRTYVINSGNNSVSEQMSNDQLSFNNLNRLDEFEKNILSLYVTYGSFDSASKASRISKPTLIRYINAIKKKIQ